MALAKSTALAASWWSLGPGDLADPVGHQLLGRRRRQLVRPGVVQLGRAPSSPTPAARPSRPASSVAADRRHAFQPPTLDHGRARSSTPPRSTLRRRWPSPRDPSSETITTRPGWRRAPASPAAAPSRAPCASSWAPTIPQPERAQLPRRVVRPLARPCELANLPAMRRNVAAKLAVLSVWLTAGACVIPSATSPGGAPAAPTTPAASTASPPAAIAERRTRPPLCRASTSWAAPGSPRSSWRGKRRRSTWRRSPSPDSHSPMRSARRSRRARDTSGRCSWSRRTSRPSRATTRSWRRSSCAPRPPRRAASARRSSSSS